MSRTNAIYLLIKERIQQEIYQENQRLSEGQLASEFSCSRTPIRQVLQKLENEQLVKIVPKSGSYVCSPSEKDLRDFTRVRAYLEGLAYRLVVNSQESLEPLLHQLQLLLNGMQRDLQNFDDIGTGYYNKHHFEFHFNIISFSNNKLLVKYYKELNLVERPSFIRKMTYNDIQKTQAEHRFIIEQIKAREESGEKFMIDHIYFKKIYSKG